MVGACQLTVLPLPRSHIVGEGVARVAGFSAPTASASREAEEI